MTRFGRVLLVIVAVAFGIRVAYVAIAKAGPCPVVLPGGSAVRQHRRASACGATRSSTTRKRTTWPPVTASTSRSRPFTHPGEKSPPAADHPPLTVFVLDAGVVAHRPRAALVGDQGAAARSRARAPVHDGAARHAARCPGRPARPACRRRHGRARRGRDRGGESEHLGQRRARDVGDAHRADGRRRAARCALVARSAELAARRGGRSAVRARRRSPASSSLLLVPLLAVVVACTLPRAVGRALEAGAGRGRRRARRDRAVGGLQPRALPRPHVRLDERRSHARRRELRRGVPRAARRASGRSSCAADPPPGDQSQVVERAAPPRARLHEGPCVPSSARRARARGPDVEPLSTRSTW